jgi:hypothetical protein
MKDTPETYEAVERWNQGKINIFDEMARLERERDEARHEIEGWSNKWECAVGMAARAEIERDEAREKCSALGKAMSYPPEATTLLRKFLQAIKEQDEAVAESEEQARLLGISAEREESVRGKLFLAERELAKLKAAANEVVKVWECPPWKIGETPSNAITQLRDAIGYED